MATTVTPGITAPWESATTPTMAPVVTPCASTSDVAVTATNAAAAIAPTNRNSFFIPILLTVFFEEIKLPAILLWHL
jgi:hypothetical protein